MLVCSDMKVFIRENRVISDISVESCLSADLNFSQATLNIQTNTGNFTWCKLQSKGLWFFMLKKCLFNVFVCVGSYPSRPLLSKI